MGQLLKPQVLKTSGMLTISQFVDVKTPGNVGVCLCGGGSRALTAGMGQLRALDYLKTPDGTSLLKQVRALSTVSGGSWVGATFMYLRSDVKNEDYLNKYVVNPNDLTTKYFFKKPENRVYSLPKNNIGNSITSKFNIISLALELLKLHVHDKVEMNMIWQTIVGNHILKPYQLFPQDAALAPSSTFTYDSKTKEAIVGVNPSLGNKDFAVISKSGSRPAFLVCNSAMFVTVKGEAFQYLVPVQSTPFFTGIMSSVDAVDANQKPVGGGGVSSFAFNSVLTDATEVTVDQTRQWSLADSIGTSSAFFAEALQNLFVEWSKDRNKMVNDIHKYVRSTEGQEHFKSSQNDSFLHKLFDKFGRKVETAKIEAEADFDTFLASEAIDSTGLKSVIDAIKDLIPQYQYWPVRDMAADTTIKPTRFADAGNLENTGINALLAYSDIDKIISFINSNTPLQSSADTLFLLDSNKQPIPNTNIEVDSQIPPLFGYQPYKKGRGYLPYTDPIDDQLLIFKFNQVFKSEDFAPFLAQLVRSAGADLQTNSAIVNMKLEVLDNPWFGISNRGSIQLVLVYTNRVKTWYNLLSPDVQKMMDYLQKPESFSAFPHYSTITKTQLKPEEINMLANLTAWTVANDQSAKIFIDLFRS